jgi:flagellar biosynthetic protein FlhB
MSEVAEKTEQPTQRKLEDAQKRGQIPRSAEVQTVLVLLGALTALLFFGGETWGLLAGAFTATLGHLHDTPITTTSLQGYAFQGSLLLLRCAGPVVVAAMVGGLLAGGLQSRFQTASEALQVNWERLDPVAGLQRVFSLRSAAPTAIAFVKLAVILLLTYGTVKMVLGDPIFSSTVGLARLVEFMADSCVKIFTRVLLALAVIAAADYGYQCWQNWQDMMMTHEEVKEESKSQEANSQVKAGRQKLLRASQRQMLAAVPTADVIVTNPTHIAIALRYDRKTMKAPRLVAKGIRLNAARIREIAQQHQVPLLENKPLARMLFKYGKVGGEVPAQLYLAVAEVLAWVYRTNPYRYYAAENRAEPGGPPAAGGQNPPDGPANFAREDR